MPKYNELTLLNFDVKVLQNFKTCPEAGPKSEIRIAYDYTDMLEAITFECARAIFIEITFFVRLL